MDFISKSTAFIIILFNTRKTRGRKTEWSMSSIKRVKRKYYKKSSKNTCLPDNPVKWFHHSNPDRLRKHGIFFLRVWRFNVIIVSSRKTYFSKVIKSLDWKVENISFSFLQKARHFLTHFFWQIDMFCQDSHQKRTERSTKVPPKWC